jgi:hypothetical protein
MKQRQLVGEAALETHVARQPAVVVHDDPHRDTAGWTDRRTVILAIGLVPRYHTTSLDRKSGRDPTAFRGNHNELLRQAEGVVAQPYSRIGPSSARQMSKREGACAGLNGTGADIEHVEMSRAGARMSGVPIR